VWRVDNIPNQGLYNLRVPDNLRNSFRVHLTDGNLFGNGSLISVINSGSIPSTPPVIDSVEGPSVLTKGAVGTWIVKARDPGGKNIQYSAAWGDGSNSLPGVSSAEGATFTHSYPLQAQYTITFTVINNSGTKAEKTVYVLVNPS